MDKTTELPTLPRNVVIQCSECGAKAETNAPDIVLAHDCATDEWLCKAAEYRELAAA